MREKYRESSSGRMMNIYEYGFRPPTGAMSKSCRALRPNAVIRDRWVRNSDVYVRVSGTWKSPSFSNRSVCRRVNFPTRKSTSKRSSDPPFNAWMGTDGVQSPIRGAKSDVAGTDTHGKFPLQRAGGTVVLV